MNYELALDAAKNLYQWVKTESSDPKMLSALDKDNRLDALKEYPIPEADSRLGVLCIIDVLKCFNKFGHQFSMDRDESKALSLILFLLMMPNATIMIESEIMMDTLGSAFANELYEIVSTTIQVQFDEERLLSVELFRAAGVDEEVVSNYIVLLYRYMLVIAECDQDVTPKEKEWLGRIMSFQNKEEQGAQSSEEEALPAAISDKCENPMEQLQALIGLQNVKTEVENIFNLITIQNKRREKGMKTTSISYHCVFTGNPGTGKTTVARILASIYHQLGILESGHLVETDRSGLVAEYVGQTAVKTNKIIDTALDGVLFIDEAYSLVQGGGNDFGREAISTLLKRMEDDRERLVVIIAGYNEEMHQFIDSNPGLQSRFNRYIHFEDYDIEELVDIFKYNLRKYDYRLTPDAEQKLTNLLTEAVENKDKNFGNARYVRNLFEKTLENQARRLVHIPMLDETALAEITADDIPN